MGDRISISFKKKEDESVVLFSHWRGRELLKDAQKYIKWLKKKLGEQKLKEGCEPIDRLEPETVMIDFIRWLTKDEEIITSDLYLGKDGDDGDNSDNGHFVIDLKTGEVE